MILTAAMAHIMQDIPLDKIDKFREGLVGFLEEEAADLCRRVDMTGKLSEEDKEELVDLGRKFLSEYLGKAGD